MYRVYSVFAAFLFCVERCPSGDNPYTCEDEEDCNGISQTGGLLVGEFGNKCHMECSNRGFCNRNNGTCSCFEGSTGVSCSELADGIEPPACLPTGQPTSTPTFTYSPSGQPSGQPTSTPSSMPSGILLLQANVTDCHLVEGSVGKTTATVNCTVFVDTFDAEALVYCGAFRNGAFPAKSEDVIRQQNSALTDYGAVEVLLENLIPSTYYEIFCTSVTKAGVLLEIDQVIRTRMVGIDTQCCRSVGMEVTPQPATEDSFKLSGLTIVLPALPNEGLSVTLSAFNFATNEPQPSITFNPPILTFLPTSLLLSASTDVVVGSNTAGKYWLNITVAGNSSGAYQIDYFSPHTLLILNETEVPPTPTIQSAVFANDGASVLVTFDSNTDQAFLDSNFQCDALLSFISNFLARCVWLNLYQLTISINDDLIPGFAITIIDGLLRAECKSTASLPCANYTTASGSVIVQTAVTPVVPTVLISGESLVNSCGNLTVDLSASFGNAGRDWFESPRFAIVTSTASDPSGILSLLQNDYIISPPTAISHTLLEPGAKYTIEVTLCNFLSVCNTGTHFFAVDSSDSRPNVNIVGPTERTIVGYDSLLISTRSVMPVCGGQLETHHMTYNWFIYELDREPSLDIPSVSLSDTSKYALNPYTLRTNSWYRLKVVGTYTPTGEFSQADTYIIVDRGAIVPIISGGEELSLRANTTFVMSGTETYDEGSTVTDQLTFAWTCTQLFPVYSTVCPLALVSRENGRQLSVSANVLLEFTQSRVVLTVSDNNRTSSTEALVNSVPVLAPLITPSNPASPILRNAALKLSAVITTSVPCMSVWSVNATEVNLKKSPAPISRLITASSVQQMVHLALPPNILSSGVTYSFRISCGISSASVRVSVNQVPQYGSLVVAPFSGVEMDTVFNFAADRWYDKHLPLTYEFGIYTRAGFELVIRSESEVAYHNGRTTTSNASSSYDVRAFVNVYDVYGARANATYLYRVQPAPTEISADVLLEELASSTGVNDEMTEAIVIVGSILTTRTCDNAPDCNALFRKDCDGSTLSDNCGVCQGGYIGDESLPTSACVANDTVILPPVYQTDPTTGTTVQICNVDGDCGVYGVCTDNTCSTPSKECVLDCSGQGACYFEHLSTGNGINVCYMSDPTCTAYCVCDNGFAGVGCDQSLPGFQEKQGVMGEMVSTMGTLSLSQFATQEVVNAQAQLVASAVAGSDLLVLQSGKQLLDIATATMTNGELKNVSYTELDTLVDSASVLVFLLTDLILGDKLGVNSRFFGGLRRLAVSSDYTLAEVRKLAVTLLDTYLSLVVETMVPDQPPFEKIAGPFRLVAAYFQTGTEFHNLTVSIPRTSFEDVVNKSISSVVVGIPMVNGTVEGEGSVSISESFSKGYDFDFTPLSSNPLRITATNVNFSQGIAYTLQNNDEEAYPFLQTNFTYTTECFLGVPSFHTYFCFDKFRLSPAYNITHICTGTPGTHISDCPGQVFQPKCFPINGVNVSEDYEMCEIIEYTRFNTTCHCKVQGRYENGTLAPLSENSNPNISLKFDESYTVEVGSFKIFLQTDHYAEFVPYIRPPSYIIISFVSCVWVAGVAVFVFGVSKFVKQKFVAVLKKKFKLSSPVHKKQPALETLSNSNKDNDPDAKHNEAIWLFIDGITPPTFLPNRAWRDQLLAEMMDHHRYADLFRPLVTKEEYFKALRSLVHLFSVMLGIMVGILVVYNHQTRVDDDSCPLHLTVDACLERKTPFDTAVTYCRWHHSKEYKDTSFCYYQEPRMYIRSTLLVLMVVGIFVSFYRALVERLLEVICWVPLDETEDDDKDYGGAEVAHTVPTPASPGGTNNLLALLPSASPSPMSPNHGGNRSKIRQSLIAATTRSKVASEEGVTVASISAGGKRKLNLKAIVKRVQTTMMFLNSVKASAKQKQEEKRSQDEAIRSSVKVALKDQGDTWGSPTYFTPPPPLEKHWLEVKALELLSRVIDNSEMLEEEEAVLKEFNELVHSVHVQLCTSMTNQKRNDFVQDWSVVEGFAEGELPCTFKNDAIQAHVMRDIKYGARAAEREKKWFESVPDIPESVMGTQILHMFLADLLGRDTVDARVFYAKVAHQFKYIEATPAKKIAASFVLAGLNVLAAWLILFIGGERTRQWQLLCTIGCILHFILEIFVAETVCCAVVHFTIPHFIAKRVERILCVLHATIKGMYDLESGVGVHSAGHAELLDVPHFLFGSRAVAKVWPNLFESTVVLFYTNILPGAFGKKWQLHLQTTDFTFEGAVFFYYVRYRKYFNPKYYMKVFGGMPMIVQEILSHAIFQVVFCGTLILIYQLSYRMFYVRIVLPLVFGLVFVCMGWMSQFVILPLYRAWIFIYRRLFATSFPVGIDLPVDDDSLKSSLSSEQESEAGWGSSEEEDEEDDSWDSEMSEEEAIDIEESELEMLFALSDVDVDDEKRVTMLARRESIAVRRASIADRRATRRASTLGGDGSSVSSRRSGRRKSTMHRESSAAGSTRMLRRQSTRLPDGSRRRSVVSGRIITDKEFGDAADNLLGDDTRVALSSSESSVDSDSGDDAASGVESDPTSSYHSSEEGDMLTGAFFDSPNLGDDPDRVVDLVPKRDVIALDDYLDDSPVRVVTNSASRVGKFAASKTSNAPVETRRGLPEDMDLGPNAPPVRLPPPSDEQRLEEEHFEAMLTMVDDDTDAKDIVFGKARAGGLPPALPDAPDMPGAPPLLPGDSQRGLLRPMTLQEEERLENRAMDSMLGLFNGGEEKEDEDPFPRGPLGGLHIPGSGGLNRRLEFGSGSELGMGISPSRLEVKVLKQRERDSADALTRSMALKKEKERQLLQERLLGRKGLAPPSQIAPLPAIGGGSSPTPPPRDLQRLQSTNTIVKNLNKVETLKRTEEQSANKLKNHLSGKQEAVKANLQERLRLKSKKPPVEQFDFDISDDEDHHKPIGDFNVDVSDNDEDGNEHKNVESFDMDVSDDENKDLAADQLESVGSRAPQPVPARVPLPPIGPPPIARSASMRRADVANDRVAISDDEDEAGLGKDNSRTSFQSFQHSEVQSEVGGSEEGSDDLYDFDVAVRSPVGGGSHAHAHSRSAAAAGGAVFTKAAVSNRAPVPVATEAMSRIAHIALSDDEEDDHSSIGDFSFHSSHSNADVDIGPDDDDDDLYNFDL